MGDFDYFEGFSALENMEAEQFKDAMIAAFGEINLGQQFQQSFRRLGVPQVPNFKIGSTKLDTTELLYDHKTLLSLEFTRLQITDAVEKANHLKTSFGRSYITIIENLKVSEDEDDDNDEFDKLFAAIQKRFGLENPEPQARSKFLYDIDHRAGDDAITMEERLRRTGNLCNFGDADELNKMILQILLSKCLDKKWRMYVRTHELDLDAAMDYAHRLREDRDADKTVENTAANKVKFTKKSSSSWMGKTFYPSNPRHRSTSNNRNCGRCGKSPHGPAEKCPSIGTICKKCNLRDHWSNMCRTKKGFQQPNGNSPGNSRPNSPGFSRKNVRFQKGKRYNKKKFGGYTKCAKNEDPKDDSSDNDSFVRHVRLSQN